MRVGQDEARGREVGRICPGGARDVAVDDGDPDGPSMPAYRIGMVTRALDLGQYTLKHYERAGLIAPHASPESGFRFYTRAEFGRIIVIRSLRRMGFSVEEIAAMLAGDARGTLGDYMTKRDENARRIAELQEANRMLDRRIGTLRAFLSRPAEGELVEVPRLQFLGHFRNDALNEDVDALTSPELWRESYERAHLALRLPRESVLSDDGVFWWGLVLFDDELDELRREDPARASQPATTTGHGLASCVVRVERCRALTLSMTTGSDRAFATIREAVLAALANRELPLAGDVYAVAEAQALVDVEPTEAHRALTRRDGDKRVGVLSLTVLAPVGDGPRVDG
ncbi:MerR family transcriptional regulator [bacterium]|nr:MerR family transcriptional regulator [bacterium]